MSAVLPREASVVNLLAPERLELTSTPLAELGQDDIVCETLVTAISPGTEMAAYLGAPPLRDGVTFPRLLGYCNVARVLARGSDVRSIEVGDRILSFTSHRSHFVMRESDVLVRITSDVRSEDVVCAYLFHLGYNAVLRSDVRPGSRVLVIGMGALGLTSVAMASLAGATVTGLTDQPKPAGIAREFGASAVHGRAALSAELSDGRLSPADVVIVTTNSWADWDMALSAAGQRGTIAVLGFPGRGEPPPAGNPLDSRHFYVKQLRIEAVGASPERPDSRGFARFNQRDNLAYLVEQIERGTLKPGALVSGVYAAHDIRSAYEDLRSRKNSPITFLLRWSQN